MKRLISILLAIMIAVSLVACGASEKEEADSGETKLTVWLTTSLVNEFEQQQSEDTWFIKELGKQFEEQNPGVKIEFVSYTDSQECMQVFKASAQTGDSPDIVCTWAGNQLFELESLLVDLRDYIPQEDKDAIVAWETVTLNYEEGNKILGYPNSGNEICGVFYNKDILEACGLDYDNHAPADLETFVKDLETIKAAGYLPLYATDGGWAHSYLTGFAAYWPQISGTAAVAQAGLGKASFSEDPGFRASISVPAELYAKGLINADYASAADDLGMFVAGEAAFIVTGNWNAALLEDGVGEGRVGFMVNFPSPAESNQMGAGIGGIGQAIAVSKTCKNPELAVKFISFLNQKDNHVKIVKHMSMLPYRFDVTAEDLGYEPGSMDDQMLQASKNSIFWVDNTLQVDVSAELVALSPMAIIGDMSVEELAAALDAKAQEVNK